MQQVLLFIDNLSMKVGHAFAWCVLVLTFGTSYEVFVRYVLQDPTAWAFDLSYIMYGALFMMGGAYALSRDAHVRGDFVYRLWPPRVQASIEFVLYFIFFFPGVLALVYAGSEYAMESWRYKEASINSPIGVPVYPLKFLMPIAALFLLIQGIAQTIRCVLCMKTGQWPPRLKDVEEMESAIRAEHEFAMRREAEARAKGEETKGAGQ